MWRSRELAAILRLSGRANEKPPARGPEVLLEQIKMVAGARNNREFDSDLPDLMVWGGAQLP